MNQHELEDLLRDCISFALRQAEFNRPKTHDATERDAYFRRTAELVMKQLRPSGWTLEPPQVIQKKPSLKGRFGCGAVIIHL